MEIDLALLFAVALAYLGLLFVIAWCADSGWLPEKWVRSPLVYSLSLGVYATSWTYYGSVGLADRSGFAFLNIYLGLTGAFILCTVYPSVAADVEDSEHSALALTPV